METFEKNFVKIIGAWLLISFIFLLIIEPTMEAGLVSGIVTAGLLAARFTSRIKSRSVEEVITAVSSDDGVVQGEIRKVDMSQVRRSRSIKPHTPLIFYNCQVKRVYDDGVYASKEEFYTLDEAQAWLDTTYREELAKHQSQSLK